MIISNLKQVSYVNFGGYIISKVYHGTNIVWQKVKTLIGWVNETAWNNDEAWINS